MNKREELKQMLMQKFFVKNWKIPVEEFVEIDNFIFNRVIPEVLKSVIPNFKKSWSLKEDWYNQCIREIIEKSQKNFNIDL